MEINHSYSNGTTTGTTTTSYVVALTLENCAGAIFQIKNTAGTNGLKYKVNGYISSHASCVATAVIAETVLAHSTASGLLATITSPYAKVEILVTVQTTNTTTYQIDWIAY